MSKPKKPMKQVSEMSDEELLGYDEPGLEEETSPIEMVKPFKKAAIANADLEDTAAGNALDFVVPDSPLLVVGKAQRGMKGLGKLMGAMPKAERAATESNAVTRATSKFARDNAVQKGEGLLGYGHNPLPVAGQISEETARTYVKGVGDASKLGKTIAEEPMWKKKLRESGKLIIRKPAPAQ